MNNALRLISLTLVLAVSVAVGAVPTTISYQGRLTDSVGKPVADGTYSLKFDLHFAETGGIPLWSSGYVPVDVENGLFTYRLGSNVAFSESLFEIPTLYLQVGIEGEAPSTPLIPLSSVPYAHKALVSDTSHLSKSVADSSITGDKLATDAVTSEKIADGTISLSDIGQNSAVEGEAIVWEDGTGWISSMPQGSGGGVTTFFPGSGTNGYISNDTLFVWVAENSLYDYHLKSKGVDSTCIDDNAVVSRTIAPGSIDSTHIAKDAVGTDQIRDFSISEFKMLPVSIGESHLKNDAVSNRVIADGAVDSSSVAHNAIKTIHMSDSAVTGDKLAWQSVSKNTIADGAVTSDKIANNTINPVDLSTSGASIGDVIKYNGTAWAYAADSAGGAGNGDITRVIAGSGLTGGGESGDVTLAIGTGAVTSSHLASSSVYSTEIANGTIVSADISSSAGIGATKINGTAATLAYENTFANYNTFSLLTNFNKIQVGMSSGTHGHWLEARSAGSGTTNATAHFENTHPSGIALWVEATSTDLPVLISQHGTGDILRCDSWTGGWHEVFKVRNDGVTEVDELKIMGGADVSEPFAISEHDELTEGSVVVIDKDIPGKLKLSNRPYDCCVAGVVSGAGGIEPGLTLQQRGMIEDGRLVALTGRVYALADASYGAIEPGDLLTTSATPGHAMKASDRSRAHGAVIGKAMTSLESGRGLILVLVNLQ